MNEIYIAKDGKEFVTKTACQEYEYYELEIPLVKEVGFIDENNCYLLFNIERQRVEHFYDAVCKIIIHNEEELKQFNKYVVDCGFFSWEEIDKTGIWIWDAEELMFIHYNSNAECADIYLEDLYHRIRLFKREYDNIEDYDGKFWTIIGDKEHNLRIEGFPYRENLMGVYFYSYKVAAAALERFKDELIIIDQEGYC